MNKQQIISEFKKFLNIGQLEFIYVKKDGTKRIAKGTMCPAMLPMPKDEQKEVNETSETKPKRKLKEGMIFYYDLDKNGFRSFHEDSLLSFPDPTSGNSLDGYKKHFVILENIEAAFPAQN